MNPVLFITKGEGGISTSEVLQIFKNAKSIDEIKEAVEKASERLYVTWASVEVVDKAKELIPIADIAKQQEQFLERGGPVMDEHSNRLVGKTLAYRMMRHPVAKKNGVLHLNKIFSMSNKVDDQVWEEIKSGKRKGSSVGGYRLYEEKKYDEESGNASVLRGFSHMETSAVSDPCNPYAMNEAVSAVAKSSGAENQREIGLVIEAREHPSFSHEQICTIVEDHLKSEPNYYEKEQTLENADVEAVEKPDEDFFEDLDEDVEKGRVYLKPGQQPPKGVAVQHGEGGGSFYETNASLSNDILQRAPGMRKQPGQEGRNQYGWDNEKTQQNMGGAQAPQKPQTPPARHYSEERNGRVSFGAEPLKPGEQDTQSLKPRKTENSQRAMYKEILGYTSEGKSEGLQGEDLDIYTMARMDGEDHDAGMFAVRDAHGSQEQQDLNQQDESSMDSEGGVPANARSDNFTAQPNQGQSQNPDIRQWGSDADQAGIKPQTRERDVYITARQFGASHENALSHLKQLGSAPTPSESITGKESVKNNATQEEVHSTSKAGELTMETEVKKAFEELAKSIASLTSEVAKIKAKEEEEEKAPDKKEEEVEKENASSEVPGNKGKEAPESPAVENSNEKDAVVESKKTELVQKSEGLASRIVGKDPMSSVKMQRPTGTPASVAKSQDNLAFDIATGAVHKNWLEVHQLTGASKQKNPLFGGY